MVAFTCVKNVFPTFYFPAGDSGAMSMRACVKSCFLLLIGGETSLCHIPGDFLAMRGVNIAIFYVKGALPRSKAGVRSTSLGIMPLFKSENIPSAISFSLIGGGSAKGSSLKCLGRIRLGRWIFPAFRAPMPNFSSSIWLIPPWLLPYLNWFGSAKPNF